MIFNNDPEKRAEKLQQKALENINLGIDTLSPFVDPKRIEKIKDFAKNTKIEELQNAVNEI